MRRRRMAKAKLPPPPIAKVLVTGDVLIDLGEVLRVTQLSERAIRKFSATGEFPPPIKFGRRVLWSHTEIQKWIKAKLDARPSARVVTLVPHRAQGGRR